MNTIKVRANEVPEHKLHRLTPGKVYEAERDERHGYSITNDLGTKSFILVNRPLGCAHLDGGQWEVVNDNLDQQ